MRWSNQSNESQMNESTTMYKPDETRAATGEMFALVSTGDYSLRVLDGPHQGTELRLDKELIRIGRADWCDIVLVDDQWVSNVHCECWLDGRGVRLRDLNSRNGLMLDGNMVFDAYLREGTTFQVGRSNIQLISHNQQREIAIQYTDNSGLLVGKSQEMRKIFSMLSRLAPSQVSTLLTGETGTGKTSVAEAIHLQSQRAGRPFVTVNCGALPTGLIEAQLFGYEKGAFTGATSQHKGFFEQADGGTLFLDEIAELPLALQPKLLDVIERKKVRRLGGKQEFDVDFRLLTATHRQLPHEILDGRFREDLYFRLSVVVIEIPPLRKRLEDLPLLVNRLLSKVAANQGIQLTEPAMRLLQDQLWPGNIRQLRNTLERATVFMEGHLLGARELARCLSHQSSSLIKSQHTTSSHAHEYRGNELEVTREAEAFLQPPATPTPAPTTHNDAPNPAPETSSLASYLPILPLAENPQSISLKQLLESLEKALVAQALEESQFNAQEASKLLGISLGWLYNRARKYQLSTKAPKK